MMMAAAIFLMVVGFMGLVGCTVLEGMRRGAQEDAEWEAFFEDLKARKP